jgi:hypothetical protein
MAKQKGWMGFFLQWLVTSIASITLALVFGGTLGQAISFHNNEFVQAVIAGVLFGIPVGVVQWLPLRGRLNRAGWWIITTIVGYSLGFLLVLVVKYIFSYDMWEGFAERTTGNDIITATSLGVTVGIPIAVMEWLVLRALDRNTYTWMIFCPIAMGGSLAASVVVLRVLNAGQNINGLAALIALVVVGGIFGIITGVPLSKWLTSPSLEQTYM